MGKGGPMETMRQFNMSQPWTDDIEEFLAKLANDARSRSVDHEVTYRRLRWLHNLFGPLFFIISIVCAPLAMKPGYSVYSMYAFILCGIGQGLMYMVDLSGKKERHFSAAARYAEMCSDIVDVLSKPERCRPLAEVFRMRMKTLHLSLNRNSPNLLLTNSRLMIDCVEFEAEELLHATPSTGSVVH